MCSWTSLQRPPWGQKKVVIVERLKQEWIYNLSAKKNGRCRDVAVSGGSMYFLSVWSSLSYKQTLYLSVFLFLCLYYTRKVSIFFLHFLQTASLSNEMEGLFSTGSQMTTFMLFCLLGIFGALVCLGILWEVYTRCNVMVTKRKGKHYFLLYGSNSFHYGARFPWLLPGHMTSNNKRCFPPRFWAGSIAKPSKR